MTIQNEDYVLAFKEYLEELKKSAGFKIKLHTRSSPDSTSDPNAIIFKLQNNDLNQTMYLRVPFKFLKNVPTGYFRGRNVTAIQP